MNRKNLVTISQAIALRDLGFGEPTTRYAYMFDNKYRLQNKILGQASVNMRVFPKYMLLVPTVDEAIDWLRRKFDVVIYNTSDPFVDPIEKEIVYSYRVKFCNTKWGWNMREIIGQTRWSRNQYSMKREAINIAIRYIKKKTP